MREYLMLGGALFKNFAPEFLTNLEYCKVLCHIIETLFL